MSSLTNDLSADRTLTSRRAVSGRTTKWLEQRSDLRPRMVEQYQDLKDGTHILGPPKSVAQVAGFWRSSESRHRVGLHGGRRRRPIGRQLASARRWPDAPAGRGGRADGWHRLAKLPPIR